MSLPHPEEASDVLQWLNVNSVSLAEGVPITLIRQKWQASWRNIDQLQKVLESLLRDDWLSVTPHLEMPHLRLSAKGYAALIQQADRERLARMVAATTTAVAQATPAAATPTEALVATAAAIPPPAKPPSLAPGLSTGTGYLGFMVPGRTPTEIGLRNQVLHLFRDLRLLAGQQINAVTLTRYWQELALRSSDLRLAIDVLVRDHYLEARVKRYERHWLLTADGYRFMAGPVTPPALLALAQPLRAVTDSYADDDLRNSAGTLLAEARAPIPFEPLLVRWRHGRNSLLHALDLLYKAGDIDIGADTQGLFSLTAQGARQHRPAITGG
jgi:hypothetical protein